MYVQEVEDTLYEETDTNLLRLEPETFDEVWEDAVEALRQRKSVVLSTKNMEPGSAQHAIDFLSGCTLVLWGQVEDLGNGLFMFVTPDEEVRDRELLVAHLPTLSSTKAP
mmetsp:Transcript_427/g.3229  ORF Transcript_427/g.3229 Transcript_427/m.3229 type:complete len:110 (-) Transcript_427:1260-1589(-)